jgi:hypothetical protein
MNRIGFPVVRLVGHWGCASQVGWPPNLVTRAVMGFCAVDDPRWGQPVWEGWQRNEFTINRVSLDDAEYAHLVERIRSHL